MPRLYRNNKENKIHQTINNQRNQQHRTIMAKLTLTITPLEDHTELRVAGLSISKMPMFSDIRHDLCRFEWCGYYVDNDRRTNEMTAKIEKRYLIRILKEMRKAIPFTSIKIKGHYELTGEELFNEVIKES